MKADKVLSGKRRRALLHGTACRVLRRLPDASVDAMVTDPPAGISFMGKEWDRDHGGRDGWVVAFAATFSECLRVLKPGAHALVWALPRTSHWTATALEDAGFEIRDVVTHHFGTGFPKSLNVSKAIDKAAGAKRKVIGTKKSGIAVPGEGRRHTVGGGKLVDVDVTEVATDAAKQWEGWGTALKPATEHWILARKPLAGTVAANVLEHGTGALNVDGCRVESAENCARNPSAAQGFVYAQDDYTVAMKRGGRGHDAGRWPPNLLLGHAACCEDDDDTCGPCCPVAELDRQSGITKDGVAVQRYGGGQKLFGGIAPGVSKGAGKRADQGYKGSGGASRFFPCFRYQVKASRKERNAGLEGMPVVIGGGLQSTVSGDTRTGHVTRQQNNHPTVKSVELMRWLCRLVTPPDGVVLDPFMGSGSTGVACVAEDFRFIGIEREEEYLQIATRRISAALDELIQ